jgi:hypothetical protein
MEQQNNCNKTTATKQLTVIVFVNVNPYGCCEPPSVAWKGKKKKENEKF